MVLGTSFTPGLHAQDPLPPQHLEITGSHQLRLTYDCSFTWPQQAGTRAVIYLPIPPDTGGQRIDQFTSTLKGQIQTDDANPPHRLMTTTIRHDRGDASRVYWRIEIIGRFQTRQLVDGPPAAASPPITSPGPCEFLDSSESINWKSDAFQDWLNSSGLRRSANETPARYGARIFAYFRSHGRYSYPPETLWNAGAVCRHLRTDCGGFSLVFTAACRANKIPARLLVGQWFKTRELAGGTLDLTGRQAHVIAEFFDPAIGWIPEDISSTLMGISNNGDTNYFGRDPGYFFTWHVDTDFRLDTPQKPNAHVQWIQNPSPWFSANASDVYDSLSHHWTLETLN